jgi:hypothetical protein
VHGTTDNSSAHFEHPIHSKKNSTTIATLRNRRSSRLRLVHAGVSFLLPLSNPFPKLLNSEADISPNIRPAPKIQSTNAIDSLLWRTKVQERPRSRPRTNKVVAHVLSCHYTGITSACDALLSSAQNDGKRRLVADKRPSSGHQCGDCGHEHYNRISCAKCRRDEDTGDYIC